LLNPFHPSAFNSTGDSNWLPRGHVLLFNSLIDNTLIGQYVPGQVLDMSQKQSLVNAAAKGRSFFVTIL
jgi:hypothetical protein